MHTLLQSFPSSFLLSLLSLSLSFLSFLSLSPFSAVFYYPSSLLLSSTFFQSLSLSVSLAAGYSRSRQHAVSSFFVVIIENDCLPQRSLGIEDTDKQQVFFFILFFFIFFLNLLLELLSPFCFHLDYGRSHIDACSAIFKHLLPPFLTTASLANTFLSKF